VTVAGFSEADLPEGRIEAIAYREGTDKTSAARLLPGRVEYGLLVLRKGFAGDATLFQWWHAVAQGTLDRRNVSVILLDEQRQEVARWNVRRAWPTKWVAPSLRALGNEVAIETLELAHEGIELAS
jgi:phage tail-like protein